MLSSISVFLKKNIRKAAKPVFFPDYHFSHLSSSLKKQRLCRTPNTLQQCLVKSVVFKTSRPVDGDYCYWTFIQAKPDFNETEMLYIILRSFFSSTLACFLCTSLSHLDKAILLTASLVSCSYAYPRTSFKRSLRPLVSSPLTMLFLHTVLSQIPLTSPWNCSPETTGLRNPAQNTLWREARLSRTTGTDSNQHVQPPEEDLHHTTTQCWNS